MNNLKHFKITRMCTKLLSDIHVLEPSQVLVIGEAPDENCGTGHVPKQLHAARSVV
jgi:hypothetical protein